MNVQRPATFFALLLTACGAAPAPASPPAVPSAPSAASTAPAPATFAASPPGAGKPVSQLTVTLPEGWKRENADDGKCLFVEGQRSVEAPPAMVRICRIDQVPDATGAGFVAFKKKTEYWDDGVTAELVGAKEVWPGGFGATYSVRAPVDPKHPHLSFLGVWKVGGELMICDGRSVGTEAQRDKIKAVCQSASW